MIVIGWLILKHELTPLFLYNCTINQLWKEFEIQILRY